MKISYILAFALVVGSLCTVSLQAQYVNGQPVSYTKDSLILEQVPLVFGGVSPVVLDHDQTEISLVNAVTTFQLDQMEVSGKEITIENRYRFSRMDHILRIAHGFSKKGKIDYGLEMRYASSRIDDRAVGSFTQLFDDASPQTGKTYRDLVSVGVRARMAPLQSLPELTFHAYANYPMVKSEEKIRALGAQRTQLGFSANIVRPLNDRIYYFLQDDISHSFSSTYFRSNSITNSLGAFLVWTSPARNLYVFPGINFLHTFNYSKAQSLYQGNRQILGTLGASWQPTDKWSVFGTVNAPFMIESGSERIHWNRQSYTAFALGVRIWRR
jgi:hypothetical protein